jgi:hypothetical protein
VQFGVLRGSFFCLAGLFVALDVATVIGRVYGGLLPFAFAFFFFGPLGRLPSFFFCRFRLAGGLFLAAFFLRGWGGPRSGPGGRLVCSSLLEPLPIIAFAVRAGGRAGGARPLRA